MSLKISSKSNASFYCTIIEAEIFALLTFAMDCRGDLKIRHLLSMPSAELFLILSNLSTCLRTLMSTPIMLGMDLSIYDGILFEILMYASTIGKNGSAFSNYLAKAFNFFLWLPSI